MALKRKEAKFFTGYSLTVPGLASAKIHRLLRNGQTVRPTEPGVMPIEYAREFMYSSPDGVFTFGQPATDPVNGEDILIIYEGGAEVVPEPPPPPPVCDPPTLIGVVVNGDDTVTVGLPTVGMYSVRIMNSVENCGGPFVVEGDINGSDSITLGPLAVGSYKACVMKICGVGSESLRVSSRVFNIVAGPPPLDPPLDNIELINNTSAGTINGLTPAFYIAAPDAFPVFIGTSTYVMGSFSGVMKVNVTKGGIETQYIKVYKGVMLHSTQIAVNGNNFIPSITFTSSDNITIQFTNIP